jgi:hypothetical protein
VVCVSPTLHRNYNETRELIEMAVCPLQLPKRLARRLMDLQYLPHIVVINPHIRCAHACQLHVQINVQHACKHHHSGPRMQRHGRG